MTGGVVKLIAMSVHIAVFWLILVSVEGWTYHSDNKEQLNWKEAREWCQKHYTDIVMVHNENVTHFLTKYLPSRSSAPYYWIGLKNINDSWTWTDGQIANYQNWGDKEPNSVLPDENCVEYISNPNNNGKWNDESCTRQKYPVCHKAQCLNNSCSNRGHCTEQVNNFTCECEPGFIGPRCEKVVTCEQLSAPPHGSMECSGQYGNHSLSSKCTFSCADGYKLSGTAELQCNSSGAWNVPPPSCAAQCLNNSCSDRGHCIEQVNNITCVCEPGFSGPRCEKVVSCEQLSAPRHGWMECSGLYGNHSLNSKCKFSCAGGYKLRGTAELQCTSSGAWNVPPPLCAVECFPLLLFGGGLMNCTEGHDSSRSACRVECPPGHLLLGFAEFTCRADGMWESSFPLMCASFVHSLIVLLSSAVISLFCGWFCCSKCRKSKKAVRMRTQQETLNPAFEAEHTPPDGPLCSA